MPAELCPVCKEKYLVGRHRIVCQHKNPVEWISYLTTLREVSMVRLSRSEIIAVLEAKGGEMPKISAEEIRKVWETDSDRLVSAFGATLRDFGYNVTNEYIKEEVQRLIDGGEPKGGPSMFIAGWLKDGIE